MVKRIVDLHGMTREELVNHVRANKTIKKRIAGFSAMKAEALKEAIQKAHTGEIVKERANAGKASSWIIALKEWNKDKEFKIPKKGTADYDAVKKLMGKAPAQGVKVNATPKKAKAAVEAHEEVKEEVKEDGKLKRHSKVVAVAVAQAEPVAATLKSKSKK